jgi:predicted chitinase
MFLAQTGAESRFTQLFESGRLNAQEGFTYFLTGEYKGNRIHSGYIRDNLIHYTISDAIQYTGKGYIQLTNKKSYTSYSEWINKEAKVNPQLKTQLESRIAQELKDNKD